MQPTELARRMLDPAQGILSRLAEIRQLTKQGAASYIGRVRFGMTPTVAEVMTLPLAHAVTRDHPQLSLSFTTGYSGHLIDWLKRDLIDCCVSYDPGATDMVEAKPILEEALLLVGRSADRLSMARPVAFARLRTIRLVLPSPLHGLRRILDAAAARAGFALAPCIEIDSFGATVDLVSDGFAMAILPLAPICHRVGAGLLSAAPLCDPAPVRRVVMTYPLDRPVLPAARMIGATFAHIATELVTAGTWSGRMLIDDT
jgi:DNA-binding transcriptional LysR family regulator